MAAFCRGCGITIRSICFYVGYMNLLAGLINVGLHLLVVGISTNGFQCDVDNNRLEALNYPWLGPFFVLINFGTHGFYQFPVLLGRGQEHFTASWIAQCYPGIMHVHIDDILNILINLVWVRLVLSYVKALHKRDTQQMNLFFNIFLMKWVIQLIYVMFGPASLLPHLYFPNFWFLKIMDFCITFIFLFCIRKHYWDLIHSKVDEPKNDINNDNPPSYFEYLRSTLTQQKEKKDAEAFEKKGMDIVVPVEASKIVDEPKTNV